MNYTFSIDHKVLLANLSAMQPICTKRSTLEATSSIFFQVGHRELILKSTDLEISLQAYMTLDTSTASAPHAFLVPGKRVFDVVRELGGTISGTVQNNQLILTSGSVRINLNIKDASEFPPFPERIENVMRLDAARVSTMLDKVAFLIPQNNVNPALNGLLVEVGPQGIKMTATDGHSLVQARTAYAVEEERTWLLPRRAVFELKRLLETEADEAIFIGVCGTQLVFSGEHYNFFTRLLADSFPNYGPALQNDGFVAAKLDRAAFIKTLRRSVSLLSGQFLATRFLFKDDGLRVTLENRDVGSLDEQIFLSGYQGDEVNTRFYAPYLLHGVQAFDEERLAFYLKGPTRPILFKSFEPAENEDAKPSEIMLTYLVMPVVQG